MLYGEVSGVLYKTPSGIYKGYIKTMWNFSGVIKKKSCGIFRGLGFRY